MHRQLRAPSHFWSSSDAQCALAWRLQFLAGMDGWWNELDNAVLTCLEAGPMSPAEIARRLGTSEASATSLLCLLAQEGRVRIALVESQPAVVHDAHRAA